MKLIYSNSLFNKKVVSVLILCIAILAKLIQQIYFFVPTLDRASQLLLAKNLLNGNGLTINKLLSDGITQVYVPVSSWPPGYPVLISLLSFLLHISVTNAAIVFDCISIALIIYFSRQILTILNCKPIWINLYVLLTGFFLYAFTELYATDLNALGFYLWSILITLQIIKGKKIGWSTQLMLVIVNFIPLSLKYLYAPLILIPPVYLLWVGYKIKNQSIRRTALRFTIGTLVLFLVLFIFQWHYTGNSAYISHTLTGFFPGNLKNFYYVVISSFTNVVFDYSVLQHYNIAYYGQGFYLIWWFNVLISFILIGSFIYIFLKKPLAAYSLKFHYIAIGTFASLITIIELLYLSVRFQIYSKGEPWTYVQEARYMAFIVLFLQQLYFIGIYDNWKSLRPKFLKIAGYLVAFFLLVEVLHGIYFTIKISVQPKDYFGFNSEEAMIMKSVRDKIREVNKLDPSKKIYFISSEDLYSYTANLEGALCLSKDNFPINEKALSNSVILVVKKRNEKLSTSTSNCRILNSIGEFDIIQCL